MSRRRSRWKIESLVGALVMLGGCHQDHQQSMLHPASPASSQIATLSWVLVGVCTTVFVIVSLLLAMAVWKRPNADPPSATGPRGLPPMAPPSPLGNRFIVVSGVAIPAVILVALLVVSVKAQLALTTPESEFTVHVVGHMWWWEVRYPDDGIVTANEIVIPVGAPVRVEVTSADVIHSLWVPNLQGKIDMVPGKTNATWFEADRAGTFRGQCAEYCGIQHAGMGLRVIALPREQFDAWLAARQRAPDAEHPPNTDAPSDTESPDSEPPSDSEPPPDPGTPPDVPTPPDIATPPDVPTPPDVTEDRSVRRGRQVFFDAGCRTCHAIAGTEAVGDRGPNLTHLPSRQTIAAGLLPNTRDNLASWITDPQAIKPGNLMPNTELPAEDLDPLLDYLESLP